MSVLFASSFSPLDLALPVAAGLLIAAVILTLLRLWRGPNAVDRILALDLAGGCALSVMVWIAVRYSLPGLIDAAIVLALIGFLSTTALAGWIGRKGGES
ncbi:MAG: hypothetical protein SynsKO_02790 [Synoicihabitans sp.]